MQSYHFAWLTVHPHRSKEWLVDKLADGFDIHHIDGNHANDDPKNLVLIETVDHLRLHGREINRLQAVERKRNRVAKPKIIKSVGHQERALAVWARRKAAGAIPTVPSH